MRGKVYSIRSHQTDAVYIGATVSLLSKRLAGHKQGFTRWKNGKQNYTSSYEILRYDDAYIELVETVRCNNKMELSRRAGGIIRSTENCVNKRVAGRTKKEYYQENKDQILKYNKEYRLDNTEQIKQQKKEYYQDNKEQIKRTTKEYHADNREARNQQMRERYDKLKTKRTEQLNAIQGILDETAELKNE